MSKEPSATDIEATSEAQTIAQSHEEVMGRYYATIAKRDVTFARSAYAGFAEKKGDSDREEFKKIAELLPENYEMMICTDYLEDTQKYQYRAMVFINRDTKEVIVANSGTRFGMHKAGKSDLFNDVHIMMSKTPPKMKSIETLNDMILDNLGGEVGEYKIHYTGHSLGASLSDLAAADMALKCRKRGIDLEVNEAGKKEKEKKISTMTFENPGSKKIIEKMYEKAGYDPALYSQDADYKGINNKRNLINQATSPAGKMWEIEPDGQNNKMNGAQTFAFYLSRKLHRILPVISRLLETFAMGGVSGQMKTHSLQHFDDVLCQEKGKVKESDPTPKRERWWLSELITGCKKVLCKASTAKKLEAMKEAKGDIGKQTFVVTFNHKMLTASEIEAKTAVAAAEMEDKKLERSEPMAPRTSAADREAQKRRAVASFLDPGKRTATVKTRAAPSAKVGLESLENIVAQGAQIRQ